MKATFHKVACNQPISIQPRCLQGLVRGLLASNALPVTKWDPSAAVGKVTSWAPSAFWIAVLVAWGWVGQRCGCFGTAIISSSFPPLSQGQWWQYSLRGRSAICHLSKAITLPFMRALPTCSQLRDFLSSCHFSCDSLVSCSVAVGPRTWQTWRCTSCFPPLVALHLAVPLPGLTRTDDSHVLRFFAGLVQKASHWSQWNQWYHIRVGITKLQSYFRCQLMSLDNATVGCFLQLRLVIGQDTGKCTGTVWTSCSNPCCESARNQNVRHWLCELFGVRSRRTGLTSHVISGCF